MFNRYIWNNYLDAGGKHIVHIFAESLTKGITERYVETIKKLRSVYCPDRNVIEEAAQQLHDLAHDMAEDPTLIRRGRTCAQGSALESLYNEIDAGENLSENHIFSCFAGSIDYFTTSLSISSPDVFIPYYFKYNFNIFEKIAHEFGIRISQIPYKKEYRKRFFYYADICRSLHGFREMYGLSPYELCAFLYDFAPNYLGGSKSFIIENPPEPKGFFCIGGSENDFFLKNKKSDIICWQCNSEALAGDMAIMYLRSPISAMDSIWKIVSTGFNDPFFYYYRCAYIEKIKSITRISLNKLRNDTVFQKLPIVKKNMQGINGVEILPSVYNHLLDLAGCDLQRIEYAQENADELYAVERDVEQKLVKPFLARLGYAEEDYRQQLYIEIGNHNFALIPDFAILPKVTSEHHSAYILLEAKLSIPSEKKLKAAKKQARSYAKQLGAAYCVVVSREGIWISRSEDDYTADIFTSYWKDIYDPDTFSLVARLIGNYKKHKANHDSKPLCLDPRNAILQK